MLEDIGKKNIGLLEITNHVNSYYMHLVRAQLTKLKKELFREGKESAQFCCDFALALSKK
jgi:hypothetical protein